MKSKKHRASIDIAQKTWKKIKVEAFSKNVSPKKLMQEMVESFYK